MPRYRYGFDRYDEYGGIAPCKFCGARPHANLAGISCRSCGYAVARHGRTGAEVEAEWNADRGDGEPRARPRCDVRVEHVEGDPVPEPLSPREVAEELSLMRSAWELAGSDMSSRRARAMDAALGYVRRWIPMAVVRDGDWAPVRCPACDRELSRHVGDGVWEDADWLAYCPDEGCHQALDWGR